MNISYKLPELPETKADSKEAVAIITRKFMDTLHMGRDRSNQNVLNVFINADATSLSWSLFRPSTTAVTRVSGVSIIVGSREENGFGNESLFVMVGAV
jgi:hypothetical protein